jgi:iron-sulfur cluster assembly accessory protein
VELEVTDIAIKELLTRQKKDSDLQYIRLGVTGGGCAGFEYVFKDAVLPTKEDTVIDYGKFSFVVDQLSQPYLNGMTLDFVTEGLNEYFKFMNPNEQSACGCGVSVQFNEDIVSESKG